MPKTQIEKTVQVNPSLLAFTPRQVLLSSSKRPSSSIMKVDDGNNKNKTLFLNAEQKALLIRSIAQYLDRNGFSKTLKKFRSEANINIEKDDLTESSFDLEELFSKFLDMCNSRGTKNSKSHKLQELRSNVICGRDGEGDFSSAVADRKKKKTDKNADVKSVHSNYAEQNPIHDDIVSTDVSSKEKKKNKKKECAVDSEEKSKDVVLNEGKEIGDLEIDNESKEKKKKKKKKKNKLCSDPLVDDRKPNEIEFEKGDLKTPKEAVTEKLDKISKKRKRVASEENAVQPAGAKSVEVSKHINTKESKRRKMDGSEEPTERDQSIELNSSSRIEEKPWKEENIQNVSGEAQKTSSKELNGQSNGGLEKIGEKSSTKKTKKQQNDLSEPKSVKRFQRIKIEDVVISDERLKDNSYWAKDGAEIGYGAKAQDILGQVRGRDFRHEKTKKKRGTYRGGQIDLQSHSVKFNYSDED